MLECAVRRSIEYLVYMPRGISPELDGVID
jgi:hypothetical protein